MAWTKLPGLAKHLDLSQKTVRSMVKDGTLPSVKLPTGTYLFNLDDVDEALRSLADRKAKKILEEILR